MHKNQSQYRFNSMIVRLKETPENGVFGGENSFNSMIVRLKAAIRKISRY